MALVLIGLLMATFVSEDLASIGAGALVREGEIGAAAAIAAIGVGIVLGDCGLWLLGHLGGRAARISPWLARQVTSERAKELRGWLERRGAAAVFASRFLPGTRLPLYLTAGVVGMSALRFALWTSLGALVWTPAVVLFAAWSGEALAGPLSLLNDGAWLPAAAAGALVLLSLRMAGTLATAVSRRRVLARVARWSRWEFWPMWLFYTPVVLWLALLAIRYRGLSTISAANPGLPDGGIVGESKFEILSKLPSDCTIPAALVEPGAPDTRVACALSHLKRAGWSFPLILKPDVGQRGVGVRLVKDERGLREYLARSAASVLVQPYHDGPYEAGVFYYRRPEWVHGRILAVTDKHFPVLVGDGESTIEALIWAHPRFRLQADTFLARHGAAATRVLASGERFQLAIAGNHAQGTIFRDGSHLITPPLEARIDAIARGYPGFFIGRFDIRYRDASAFMAGRDLAIVELNGATAEATNIYDPDASLLSAYRVLFRQWALVFEIGAANRARGARVSSMRRLLDLIRAHLTSRPAFALSD